MSDLGDLATGFAPVARVDARVVILGSLPGKRSIEANEYYAHPRNAFWQIMAELFAVTGSYDERCESLKNRRVAVWDVLQNSIRPGSLDADIQVDTARVNDFETFFTNNKAIERVCFNGQKAAKIFASKAKGDLDRFNLRLQTLPSTSPAHAAMSFDEKLDLWRKGIDMTHQE